MYLLYRLREKDNSYQEVMDELREAHERQAEAVHGLHEWLRGRLGNGDA